MKHLKTSRSFIKEFKKQVRFSIAAAVGFSIAFAWRESIFDTFLAFVSRFLDVASGHYLTEIYTALTITVAGVILLLITSKILKD
ncbi:MAG: DUF5654 family protein [Candidatus Pacearchaeota archaeon]